MAKTMKAAAVRAFGKPGARSRHAEPRRRGRVRLVT